MQGAIGYVRVSTDDQTASGLSLDHQQARIVAYAVANEFDLVEIILDPGVSAGKPLARRPGGQLLLAALARREAGTSSRSSSTARSAMPPTP